MSDRLQEPLLELDDIQGDILVGLTKIFEYLLFFRITDPDLFIPFIKDAQWTSCVEARAQRQCISARKASGKEALAAAPGLNVAFTFEGLSMLWGGGFDGLDGNSAFRVGMHLRDGLQDPPWQKWSVLQPNPTLHGVFILTGSTEAEIINTISQRIAPAAANGWAKIGLEIGHVRPKPTEGHEHFGFADGVSQPGVRGRISDTELLTPTVAGAKESQGARGQDLLWPGEFVFGYPGQNPKAPSFEDEGEIATGAAGALMKNGAFMIFRKLSQLVPEFNAAVRQASQAIDAAISDAASPERLGAQMVGRWKSGAPVVEASLVDDPRLREGTDDVNNFEFGADRAGVKCPYAAHIRKAYPRDDVTPDVDPTDKAAVNAAEAFTQAHRMMRRGITYGPELTEAEALDGVSNPLRQRGLLFKCYVTSIEDQFEFVQQAWLNNGGFSQPDAGVDPLIGQPNAPQRFLGAAPDSLDVNRKPAFEFGRFIHLEGGAYFFAPAISVMRRLGQPELVAAAQMQAAPPRGTPGAGAA